MRLFHKMYARLFGYFWIPCPVCKRYFGGHEADIRNSLSDPSNRLVQRVVCSRDCMEIAEIINGINGLVDVDFKLCKFKDDFKE